MHKHKIQVDSAGNKHHLTCFNFRGYEFATSVGDRPNGQGELRVWIKDDVPQSIRDEFDNLVRQTAARNNMPVLK
jgi:hypothetical protein